MRFNYERSEWQIIATLPPGRTSYLDKGVRVDETSYQYKIETNIDCDDVIDSNPHRTILLNAEKADSLTILQWNDYEEWNEGVDRYELWLSVDSADYSLYETTDGLQAVYKNDIIGFDHCFYIKAIEKGGNHSWSVSNTVCVQYVPEIMTYNVITPNTDGKNDYFIIENIEHYPQSVLTILNRWGRTIYETTGYKNDWNGSVNGRKLPVGTYFFMLKLNEPRNKIKSVKGYLSILY
jgi:gliding motility-associated-like protein